MTPPPLVCPQPGPRNPGPDCPLYHQRLAALAESKAFRRSVLLDLSAGEPTLRDLIRSEARTLDQPGQPEPLRLPSSAPALPLFIHHHTKGRTP